LACNTDAWGFRNLTSCFSLGWKSEDAGGLKICVPIDAVLSQTEITLISGSRMAQTRRKGENKTKERIDQSAEVFVAKWADPAEEIPSSTRPFPVSPS
jgi:hypothetical protein